LNWRVLALLVLTGIFTACTELGTGAGPECLAPANAGGGWDLTCRSLARIFPDVVEDSPSLRVSNLPGAGGGIAFANVVSQRSKDGNLIVAASPATTLRLAQGQYGDFTEDDVRWLGAIAADFGLIVVRADAPWQDLPSLIQDWRRHPESIVVAGGSAVGGQDHMKVLLLGREGGLALERIRYVPFDGGGEALTALLGGFVQVVPADASEVLGQIEAGAVRALAVLAEERLAPPLDDVPTAGEQGFEVQWPIWRGFYAPAGISEDAHAEWLEVLDGVARSEEWAALRRQLGLSPFSMVGAEFEAFVEEEVTTLRDLTRSLGLGA
jgi:putative tricarboxylic transport membrane protein